MRKIKKIAATALAILTMLLCAVGASGCRSNTEYFRFRELPNGGYSVSILRDFDGTELKIPAGRWFKPVREVGYFQDLDAVEKIVIPKTVKWIASGAFEGCSNLKEVVLPDSLESIGSDAFYDCISLESVSIPAGVNVINQYTFKNCRSLSQVELPSGLREIGDQAFWGCESLTRITIPASVVSIGQYAFHFCERLALVTFEDPTGWCAKHGDDFAEEISEEMLKSPFMAAIYLAGEKRDQDWEKRST